MRKQLARSVLVLFMGASTVALALEMPAKSRQCQIEDAYIQQLLSRYTAMIPNMPEGVDINKDMENIIRRNSTQKCIDEENERVKFMNRLMDERDKKAGKSPRTFQDYEEEYKQLNH